MSIEPHRLFTCCPNCGAHIDFDSDTSRHYVCGTRGDYDTGVYVSRCNTYGEVGTHAAACDRRLH